MRSFTFTGNFWAAFLLIATIFIGPSADARHYNQYGGDYFFSTTTYASGEQELPTVHTMTRGAMVLKFQKDFSRIKYRVRLMNGVGVTMAHLHCGAAGETGALLVDLFQGNMTVGVDINGVLVHGNLLNDDIINQTCANRTINNVASLYNLVREGFVYLNVHTVANPEGEVRGQFFV